MSQSRLFDYNSSFSAIRTNPKLTGNFKISIDSKSNSSLKILLLN